MEVYGSVVFDYARVSSNWFSIVSHLASFFFVFGLWVMEIMASVRFFRVSGAKNTFIRLAKQRLELERFYILYLGFSHKVA